MKTLAFLIANQHNIEPWLKECRIKKGPRV